MTDTPKQPPSDSLDGIERQALAQFTEQAYMDYAMYVILDRALPHIADGLKPVQRRIVYAMSELALGNNAKPKKSARTVGDVIGKFHPHGDSACYEAMVLMAQDFSYRYPLIDGQGNWGSQDDPKSFAAMRYTEAKLTRYADVLLSELGQGTVDYQANFDGTLKEPELLPARLPNLLLNGGSGIAVGMATDIPPHNAHEVAQACICLLDDPGAGLDDLLQHLPAPDYPTEATIISSPEELTKLYASGSGNIRARAAWEKENGDLIITALPHQVSGAKVLEQIAAQINAKKLPMVSDLRDESDHENPVRLVITPRSNRVDNDALIQHLCATTDLERSYRVNLNCIGLDGKPQVKNLVELLREWLEYRTQTTRRRLQHRLDQILERLHILDGLLIAFLNIDEVIAIIRHEDRPKDELIARFGLSDIQTEAILNLKLRHLAKLEEIKIRGEQQQLSEERDRLQALLGSPAKLKALIRQEIQDTANEHGDARRSPIQESPSSRAISEDQLSPSEAVTVILSEQGWVRAAKGHDIDPQALNYKAGDAYLTAVRSRSNAQLAVFDTSGRLYSLPTRGLPSARSQGEPLTGRYSPPDGAQFQQLIDPAQHPYWLLAASNGYGFITAAEQLNSRNKAGKHIVKLGDHTLLSPSGLSDIDNSHIAIATNAGQLLIIRASELPQMARGKGNKIIAIPANKLSDQSEQAISIATLSPGQSLKIHAGKRHMSLKPNDIPHYLGERGRRGKPLPRGYQRVIRLESL